MAAYLSRHARAGLWTAALLGGFACGGPTSSSGPLAQAPAARSTGAVEGAPAIPFAPEPRLRIAVVPKSEAPEIEVSISAAGKPTDLVRWSGLGLDGARDMTASDHRGAMSFDMRDARLVLAREPEGEVVLTYRVAAGPANLGRGGAPVVDPLRAELPADRIVAVPEAWRDQSIAVDLEVSPEAFGDGAAAASTLGVGSSRRGVTLTGEALERVLIVAGRDLGHAVFDGPEGHDEAAWIGYTAFDPRIVAAEVAGFRTASAEFFGDRRRVPMTLLLVGDNRPAGAFVVERRPGSVALYVGAAQRYDAPVRVSVYHQVLAQWVGASLWIGPADPERAAESLWFRGGVARYLARELAFQFGLLSPIERRDEIEHLVEIALLSDDRDTSATELFERDLDDATVALLVARGALYATWLDAALRASKTAPSLDEVLRGLMKQALTDGQPLPTQAWIDAIGPALPPGEAAASFRMYVEGNRVAALGAGALGPCFRPRTRSYQSFSLGFTDRRQGDARTVAELEPSGPAARAGLREGDRIRELTMKEGRPDVDVEIEVEQDGATRRIRYRPVGKSVEGPGFARDPSVPEARCAER